MKLINSVNESLALKGTAYTPDEIDKHDNAARIWATIAQCREEADSAYKKGFDDCLWFSKRP
jgi:hypothetical protein